METYNEGQSDRLATAAFVCALLACCFNLLVITSFLGIPFGIIALIFAAISYRRHRLARAAFVLSLISFFIVAVYLLTLLSGWFIDPSI